MLKNICSLKGVGSTINFALGIDSKVAALNAYLSPYDCSVKGVESAFELTFGEDSKELSLETYLETNGFKSIEEIPQGMRHELLIELRVLVRSVRPKEIYFGSIKQHHSIEDVRSAFRESSMDAELDTYLKAFKVGSIGEMSQKVRRELLTEMQDEIASLDLGEVFRRFACSLYRG